MKNKKKKIHPQRYSNPNPNAANHHAYFKLSQN